MSQPELVYLQDHWIVMFVYENNTYIVQWNEIGDAVFRCSSKVDQPWCNVNQWLDQEHSPPRLCNLLQRSVTILANKPN